MKTVLCSVAMAFSMFSKIPVPMVEWKRENMKYMLCALPLVGAAIALALCVWYGLCQWLAVGSVLYAVGLTLLPVGISGGIHMDGFCDTVDALSSHALPERKREILKDSHAGAFAIIYASAYLLLYAGLCTELERSWRAVVIVGVQHVFARALGGLAGVAFPGSSSEGLLAAFRDGAGKKAALLLTLWCAVCAGGLIALSPVSGVVCALAGGGLLWDLRRMSQREFGGMSGDLAGYLMTLAEVVLLACFIFAEKVVAVCF